MKKLGLWIALTYLSCIGTLHAALELAKRDDMAGKTIVVIIASTAERYITTDLFNGLE